MKQLTVLYSQTECYTNGDLLEQDVKYCQCHFGYRSVSHNIKWMLQYNVHQSLCVMKKPTTFKIRAVLDILENTHFQYSVFCADNYIP